MRTSEWVVCAGCKKRRSKNKTLLEGWWSGDGKSYCSEACRRTAPKRKGRGRPVFVRMLAPEGSTLADVARWRENLTKALVDLAVEAAMKDAEQGRVQAASLTVQATARARASSARPRRATMSREVAINWGPNQKFVTLLTQAGARFLVTGSTAARFHVPAWLREPDDLDLLCEASVENGRRFIEAWSRAGGPPLHFTAEALANPNKQVRDRSTLYLDVLTPSADFDFQEAWAGAEEAVMMGSSTSVRVASIATLLRLYRIGHARVSEDVTKYASSIEALEQAERQRS